MILREDSDAICLFGLVWDFFCFSWVKKKKKVETTSFFFVAGISNFSLASKLAKQNWTRESDLAFQNDGYNTWIVTVKNCLFLYFKNIF